MNKSSPISYFAAANSYRGFVSFFKDIFPSEYFNRAYVLKGGPGTGKSSLMKKIAMNLYDEGYAVEKIHCSSDPSSLDGIIILGKNGKIAIIDGTAPHERDAVIPGAIDEIINLGENWEKDFLVAEREEILKLSFEKAKAYETAYQYLKTAGKNHEYIFSAQMSSFNKSKAKSLAEYYLKKIRNKNKDKTLTRIISSFGKNGTYTLPLPNEEMTITVGGGRESSSLFLNEILCQIEGNDTGICIYKNALDQRLIDALQIDDILFVVTDKDYFDIDTGKLSVLSPLDKERIKTSEYMKNVALDESIRWFKVASDIHFRLEEIYGRAMNFEKNDLILCKILEEIKNIL